MSEIHQEHDKGYKDLLTNKRTFVEMIRNFISEKWVDDIDEEDIILVDKSFITQDFRGKEADIIYRLKIEEKDVIFYCLLELQSKVDFLMPFRLFEYIKCIWDEEIKNTEEKELKKKGFRLPAVVPLVIYNGKNSWTAKRHFKEMINGYEIFDKYMLDFSYILFDVNRYKKEDLLKATNLISTAFYIDQEMEPDEILKRIMNSIHIIKNVRSDQIILFKRWLKKIISQRMPENNKKDIEDIIEKANLEEVEEMVSNLGLALDKMKREAEEKAIVKVAEKALIKGAEVDFVVAITGLKIDVVKKLYKELQEKDKIK